MIVWMLQSLLVAAMIAGAAVAIEEGTRVAHRPLRWGWLVAMVGAGALPLIFRYLLPAAPAPETARGALDPGLLEALLSASPAVEGPESLVDRVLHAGLADPFLAAAWTVVAAGMGGALLLTYRRLAHVRASAQPVEIAGVPALLTRATGPMVVGIRRPEVVVPAWIGELTEGEQRLVLRHEWEHVRAGDTRLLLAGAVLVAAMPWNLPLWWMRSRLRQAIEVDCDARVLAAGTDRRLYGSMLIHTAGRPRPAPLLAPALVELPSMLERRIIAMTRSNPSHRGLRFGIATVVAILLVAAACELTPRGTTPSPTEPTLAEVLDAEGEVAVDGEEGATAQRVPAEAVLVIREGGGVVRLNAEGDTVRVGEIRVRTPLASLSTGSARPLILVDGERTESLGDLNPSQIQSINVLKDEAATARYGPEGADGVVLVTTRVAGVARVEAPRSGATVREAEVPVAVVEAATERVRAATTAMSAAPSPAGVPAVAPARAGEARVVEGVVAVGYGVPARARAVEPARVGEAKVVEGVVTVGYGVPGPAPAVEPAEAVEVVRYDAPEALRAPTMRIRGATTVAPAAGVSGEPLVLVDGEEIGSMAQLRDRIAPDAIASITVLKDESATSLYGARGRNGVILVTLKK